MALVRQEIEIPLAGGLAQQVDPRVLAPGKWTAVDNLLPDRQGVLTRRPGYAAVSHGGYPMGAPALPDRAEVIDSRLGEVLAHARWQGRSALWSWAPDIEAWAYRGTEAPCSLSSAVVSGSRGGGLYPRVAVADTGASAWTWVVSETVLGGGLGVTSRLLSESGGALSTDETIVSAPSPGLVVDDVLACGDDIVHLYQEQGNDLMSRRTVTTTGAVAAPVVLVATPWRWAASAYDSSSFVVCELVFPDTIVIRRFSAAGVLLSSATQAFPGAGFTAIAAHAVPGVGVAVLLENNVLGGNVLLYLFADVTWVWQWGATEFALAGNSVRGFGVHLDAAGTLTAVTEGPFPDGPWYTQIRTRDVAGAPLTLAGLTNTECLTQPFREAGVGYVPVIAVPSGPALSPVPPHRTGGAACLVDDGGALCAVLSRDGASGTASLFAVGGTLARPARRADGEYAVALSELAGSPLVANGHYDSVVASKALSFAQRQSALRVGAEQREALTHSGGFASWYDSVACTEIGFTNVPLMVEGTPSAAGGHISGGTYLYQFVWEWYDENGLRHSSGPSLPATVTVPPGTTGSVVFKFDSISLTRKNSALVGAQRDITLAAFRTTAGNASPFYRLTPHRGSQDTLTLNAPALSTITFTDTIADGALAGPLPLALGFIYTEGGVVPNETPPAPRAVLSAKNRLWIATGRELWFSKPVVQGEGPGFSSEFVLYLDDANDDIVALAELDDKVVVFTADRIYYVAGDGPNAAGGGGGFIGPIRVPTDGGCADARSVATTTEGVLFWCGSALWRLTRGLQIEPVGDPVLDTVQGSVGVITKLDVDAQRAYVLCESAFGARFAILDYRYGQWVTQTNYGFAGDPPAPAPTRIYGHHWNNGTHWVVTPSAVARRGGVDTDLGATFVATLQTPWVHVAGVNGYQRCWDVGITGRRLGGHWYTVAVHTDYDDATARQVATYDLTAALGAPVDRVSLHMRSQLCSAVRVTLSDAGTPAPGAVWDVAGVTLGIGVKGGNARLPAQNKAG